MFFIPSSERDREREREREGEREREREREREARSLLVKSKFPCPYADSLRFMLQ